ncbi:hypothetical protein [Terrabacter terrigena]|uniref:DUF2510 domain-containing protein n=1 Tax=Terrabacter terrigena TaxID=574718 RepID=A0ABW3MZA2_9MICO
MKGKIKAVIQPQPAFLWWRDGYVWQRSFPDRGGQSIEGAPREHCDLQRSEGVRGVTSGNGVMGGLERDAKDCLGQRHGGGGLDPRTVNVEIARDEHVGEGADGASSPRQGMRVPVRRRVNVVAQTERGPRYEPAPTFPAA